MADATRRHLPELAEADASPPIRAIYDDIRRLTGVPMAALIFRHLATLPGVLEEAWSALGPLMRVGMVQEEAWRLARETALPDAPSITPIALKAAGIAPADQTMVLKVLDAYNRANPVNHLGLLALAARADAGGAPAALPVPEAAWQPPDPIGALPPMMPPERIPDDILALLASLSTVPDPNLAAVPSLYRHLVDRPGLLALFHVVLAPRIADGSITVAIRDLSARAAASASGLARHMPAVPLLAARPEAQDAIRRFSSLIPQMVVIGGMLRRSMSARS